MWYTNRMEDLANYPCLVKRNNTWYVRKRVPKDLADYLSKKEVKRTLKTQDKKEAMKKYHQGLAVIETEFETARIRMNNPSADDMLSTYDDAGIRGLVYDWYIETTDRLDNLDKKNTNVYDDEDIKHALIENESDLDKFKKAATKNDYEIIDIDAQRYLGKRQITFKKDNKAYHLFCYYFIRADIHLQKHYLSKLKNKPFPFLPDMFESRKTQHASLHVCANNGYQPSKIVRMSELAKKYIARDDIENISNGSKENYIIVARLLKEFLGRDILVHEISYEILEEFRGALRKMPKLFPVRTYETE